MATEIIEIQAQALQIGDRYDTRCGIADLAFQIITSVRTIEINEPGRKDRVEIAYGGGAMCNTRVLLANATVRIAVEVPDALVAARPVAPSRPKPMDHQPKQPHRPARKPGRHDSPTRRAFNLTALVARVNAGRVTVADYLAQLGADSDTIRRYGSVLGRKVAAAYRARFGAEPVRDGLAVVGRHLTRCFSYGGADAEILREAAISYPKTSRFVGV